MNYYIEKLLNEEFEEAASSLKEKLQSEGFGIVTEINFHEKFKEKLGVTNYRKYRVLGACNPALAYDALEMENKIGTMLPCNIIVRELSPEKTEVAAIDPVVSMQSIENDNLRKLAILMKLKLRKAIEKI